MKHIKAFTMVELLVAMIFTGIIISFAFSILSNTNKSFRKANRQWSKSNELLQLQSVLNIDCNKAQWVFFKDSNMIVKSIDNKRINYEIGVAKVVRYNGLKADTFHIGTCKDSVQYLFDTPPLMESLKFEIPSKDSLPIVLEAKVNYTNRVKLEYAQKIKTENYPYGY